MGFAVYYYILLKFIEIETKALFEQRIESRMPNRWVMGEMDEALRSAFLGYYISRLGKRFELTSPEKYYSLYASNII